MWSTGHLPCGAVWSTGHCCGCVEGAASVMAGLRLAPAGVAAVSVFPILSAVQLLWPYTKLYKVFCLIILKLKSRKDFSQLRNVYINIVC